MKPSRLIFPKHKPALRTVNLTNHLLPCYIWNLQLLGGPGGGVEERNPSRTRIVVCSLVVASKRPPLIPPAIAQKKRAWPAKKSPQSKYLLLTSSPPPPLCIFNSIFSFKPIHSFSARSLALVALQIPAHLLPLPSTQSPRQWLVLW